MLVRQQCPILNIAGDLDLGMQPLEQQSIARLLIPLQNSINASTRSPTLLVPTPLSVRSALLLLPTKIVRTATPHKAYHTCCTLTNYYGLQPTMHRLNCIKYGDAGIKYGTIAYNNNLYKDQEEDAANSNGSNCRRRVLFFLAN